MPQLPIHPQSTGPNWGGIWRFGPGSASRVPSSRRWNAEQSTTGLIGGSRNLQQSRGIPTTGGGYQAPTPPAGPTGPNALEDLLRNRIRRIQTLGRGERTNITDEGLERGLGRSLGRPMEEQRQRQTESVAGAERDFLAGEFESQRQSRAGELQAELERARLAQQMTIEQQRAAQEMRLAQMRMASESEQNALDRTSAEARAAYGGGGGEGVRLSDLTGRRPGGYGGAPVNPGFGGWNEDEARRTAAYYREYGNQRPNPFELMD